MERSAIQDRCTSGHEGYSGLSEMGGAAPLTPDYAALHPGYSRSSILLPERVSYPTYAPDCIDD